MTDMKQYAVLDWTKGMEFTAGSPHGPRILIDGNGKAADSPVTLLACAMGACAGSDVVSILEKQRVKLARCRIEVSGVRNQDYPKRFLEVSLKFILSGEGITEAGAQRAVELSVTKYCSVLLSMNPEMKVNTEVVLET